jgi:threonine/homoserine/homoserine lactone efflux protein
MMTGQQLVTFMVVSVVLVLVPGPMVLFVVSRALAHGRRSVVGSSVGNATGSAVLVVLVALGVGSLVAKSLAAFMVIKLLGAAYLIYLGVRTFRERGSLVGAMTVALPPGSSRLVYRQGVVVGLTNPKSLMFFLAVLPQFVDPHRGAVPVQMAVLGLVFVVSAMVLDCLWGLAAASVRDWVARSPERLRVVGGVSGLTMIGLGMGVAVTGRRD